jgi:hypothetical protein
MIIPLIIWQITSKKLATNAMQASGLGRVSHNKRHQAMNPSLLIVAVAIDVVLNERHQSLVR